MTSSSRMLSALVMLGLVHAAHARPAEGIDTLDLSNRTCRLHHDPEPRTIQVFAQEDMVLLQTGSLGHTPSIMSVNVLSGHPVIGGASDLTEDGEQQVLALALGSLRRCKEALRMAPRHPAIGWGLPPGDRTGHGPALQRAGVVRPSRQADVAWP